MCLPDLYLVFIGEVVMSTPDQVLVIRAWVLMVTTLKKRN